MCTLIFGIDVLGPGTLVVGANRDENPARDSEPPHLLSARPHVVGGMDLVSGGTWLAIRDGRAVVALLNRRDPDFPHDRRALRSRGLLALDVARAAPDAPAGGYVAEAREAALRSLAEHRYAPCTLVCLAPGGGWLVSHDGGERPATLEATPRWHVITHADLDDAREPRTRRLLGLLEDFQPHSALEAEARLLDLLSLHGEPGGASDGGDAPAVCIHEGRMVTVSSSLFTRDRDRSRYLHVEGRPCTVAPQDLSALLDPSHTPTT